MPAKVLRGAVNKLNCVQDSSKSARQVAQKALQTEWELALSDATHRTGSILFEKESGGSKKLDIQFKSRNSSRPLEFAFDITAISDQHAEELQIEAQKEMAWLVERLVKAGLGCCPLQLDFAMHVKPNGKFEPGIPRDDTEREWLLQQVIAANDAFAASKLEEHIEIRQDHIRFFVSRINGDRLSWRCNAVYSAPSSLTANPLSNALKNKNDQLVGSGYLGTKGVFVCDANCDSIHQVLGWSRAKSTAQIVQSAQERFSGIDFVAALETRWEIDRQSTTNRKVIVPQFFFRDPAIEIAIRPTLEEIVRRLPSPAWDSANALIRLENNRDVPGSDLYGGWSTDDNSIRISARALLRLFACDLDAEKFLQDHRLVADPRRPSREAINSFAFFLRQKRSIVKSRIESDGDDEWIIFEFGEVDDPALSAYRYPAKQT